MRRFAVLFICWKRHHYDKSTLSLLSDTVHQKLYNDKYFSIKQQMPAAITEKKVEIWHSLLRDSIEGHYTAQQIRLNAQLLSVNKIQHEFCHHFVPEYQRGTGERDQTLLVGRSAEFNAVKCNLTKLTTKRSWYLSSGQRSAVGRAGSVPPSVVACFSVAYRSGFCS